MIGITFNVTPLNGNIQSMIISTPGFGHNSYPLSVRSTLSTKLGINLENNYNEYVTTGAIFYLSIKWME